jgi:hypothetical protein
MASIYSTVMSPLISPQTPYVSTSGVIGYRLSDDNAIAQEIYRRSNGTLGYRYVAWVNFSDAGGGAHHMWWPVEPRSNLVTDDYVTACQVAETDACECDVSFAQWRNVNNA